MDIVNSPMQFIDYRADKINFEINDEYTTNKEKIVEISPTIKADIKDLEDNKFTTTLNLKIEEESNSLPFRLEITITGLFEIEEDLDCKDSLKQNNSIVILLPYLRSLVTAITAGANIPPLVLPVLNLNGLFNE